MILTNAIEMKKNAQYEFIPHILFDRLLPKDMEMLPNTYPDIIWNCNLIFKFFPHFCLKL